MALRLYEDRMTRSYGTTNLMEDPEYINKLLQNRKIAKVVRFKKKGNDCNWKL